MYEERDPKLEEPATSVDDVELWIAALHSPNEEIQEYAISKLRLIGAPAIRPLLFAVFDANPETRSSAIIALGKIGLGEKDEKFPRSLIIASLSDPDAKVRYAATQSLSDNASSIRKLRPDAIDSLTISLRKDSDKKVRGGAAWALGVIGDSNAVEPLLDTLSDPDEEDSVRSFAWQALKEIGGSRVLEGLKRIKQRMSARSSQDKFPSLVENLIASMEPRTDIDPMN